jgi:hypothetical protein
LQEIFEDNHAARFAAPLFDFFSCAEHQSRSAASFLRGYS